MMPKESPFSPRHLLAAPLLVRILALVAVVLMVQFLP